MKSLVWAKGKKEEKPFHPGVPLNTVKSLTKELEALIPFLDKYETPEELIEVFQKVMDKPDSYVSDRKREQMLEIARGMGLRQLQEYIKNIYLKGIGLGIVGAKEEAIPHGSVILCVGTDRDRKASLEDSGNWQKRCPKLSSGGDMCDKHQLPLYKVAWSPDYPGECEVYPKKEKACVEDYVGHKPLRIDDSAVDHRSVRSLPPARLRKLTKGQAQTGIPPNSSFGWNEEEGDFDAFRTRDSRGIKHRPGMGEKSDAIKQKKHKSPPVNRTMMGAVGTDDAKDIGDKLGVDWNEVDLEQLRKGIKVEMEHKDTIYHMYEKDVAVAEGAAKIALDHLKEMPDYYDKLAEMEKSGSIFDGGYC